jgi:hypothetical protein
MKAITTGSKKAKGSRLERLVATRLRALDLDKDARRMIGSGAFDGYKGDVYAPQVPLTFECKNNENHSIWKEWEQAKNQEKPMRPACLVISGNHRPVLAMVELETLLDMLLEIKQLNKLNALKGI